MATWDTLRNHVLESYKVADDGGSFLKLLFDLGNGRSQIVFVRHLQTRSGDEWAAVESPIGELDRLSVHAVLASVSDMVCGGLGRVGDLLTLRDAFPLADLDVNEFEAPLALITSSADRLEREHVGNDKF